MSRKKEYKEDAVVEKAMHTFWANGYENTSLRMLEKDMGINQFSIYSSFGSKKGLFVEVLKKYRSHVKEFFLKDLLNSEADLSDIQGFFRSYGHGIQSGENPHGCLMMNTGMEVDEKDPDTASELNTHFYFLRTTFYLLLEKAKHNKDLVPNFDSQKYALFLVGSLQGLSLFAKIHTKKEVDEYIDTIFSTLN